MTTQQQTGKLGEEYAAQCLIADGYTILHRNFHCRFGELDIVAQIGDVIAFVEVKTRSTRSLGTPGAAVGLSKQRRLITTALWYLSGMKEELQPRFDVFEVIVGCAKGTEAAGIAVLQHNHIPSAFDAHTGNTRFC